VVSRSAATAVLVALGIWLFFTLIWPMLVPGIAATIAPPDPRYALFGYQDPVTVHWQELLRRFSPNELFNGASIVLLAPDTRQVSQIVNLTQWQGAILGAPLPLTESLAIAWPQVVALIAGVIVLFVAGYVVFQRQEVRA
jgi:ABC-2 type transport system permease protein